MNFHNIYCKNGDCFYSELEKWLKKSEKKFIVTANPETFMLSEKDEVMKKIMNDTKNVFVPDGIAVVKMARANGVNVSERITGVDIAQRLFGFANEHNKSVYLFGSEKEVINAMKEIVYKKYPNIDLLGVCDGYVKDKDKVMEKIITKKPDILMVALGIPAQEKLIYKYLDRFDKGIFIGVGGSFDVLSGMKKRAPKIFIKTNLEWLYRIVKEPRRIKRFYHSNVKFLFKARKK